ncbi:MAG: hypothetical protein QOG67_3510 [Verrucomicrobiota bacterium]
MRLYARKIQKTADGRRRRPCRQTWRKISIVAQRCISPDGKIDERETTQRLCGNETEEFAAEKEAAVTRTPLTAGCVNRIGKIVVLASGAKSFEL